ncbi:MAG: hypothetical protein ACYSW4_01090, partial [Planctomycetota bacterium]
MGGADVSPALGGVVVVNQFLGLIQCKADVYVGTFGVEALDGSLDGKAAVLGCCNVGCGAGKGAIEI